MDKELKPDRNKINPDRKVTNGLLHQWEDCCDPEEASLYDFEEASDILIRQYTEKTFPENTNTNKPKDGRLLPIAG